ncbi:MAG: hypothetical protein R3B84_17730 [Zavarzinella sp.]
MNKRLAAVLFAALAFCAGYVVADLMQRAEAQEAKGPKWSHGLLLRVRPADQADFNKDTPKIGVEVFKDENNGNLIYITEKGNIAVVKQ